MLGILELYSKISEVNIIAQGNRLFKIEGSGWKIINDDQLVFSLGGSSSKNIFGAGINATVYHFNGSDWQKITIKEGFQEIILDVWTDGTEAFMIASDGRKILCNSRKIKIIESVNNLCKSILVSKKLLLQLFDWGFYL